MSFILKPNNRKNRSGSTLIAKIVSPDKKDFIYKEYPVLVQEQTLTDQEAVIRDMQQLDAILSGANVNWANITEEIKELSVALKSATNGSTIDPPTFTIQNMGDLEIVSKDGKITNRPKYDGEDSTDFSSTMNIKIHKGDVEEIFSKDFVVPAYTAQEIVEKITSYLGDNIFWNYIKGNNNSSTKIFSDLAQPSVTAILNQSGLYTMINMDKPANIPTLSFEYPEFYTTPLLNSEGKYTRPDSDDIYGKDSLYNIEPVTDTNAYDIGIANYNSDKNYGLTVAYAFSSKKASENKIVGTFELDEATASTEIKDVAFISSVINISDVTENIIGSAHQSWILGLSIMNHYSITDALLGNNNSSVTFTVPNNSENIVIRIPNNFLSMTSEDVASTVIGDVNNIGYSTTDGVLKGFTNQFATIAYTFNTPVVITDSPIYTGTPTGETVNSVTVDGTSKFAVLEFSDIPSSGITGVFSIVTKDTNIGNTFNIQYSFTIKKATS